MTTNGNPRMSFKHLRDFPFKRFSEVQDAIRTRRFKLGVDPMVAARWSDQHNTRPKRFLVSSLSILLLLAGGAAVVAAFVLGEYWLLAALPIQFVSFYISHPGNSIQTWVTIGGAASVAVFLNLLFNGYPVPALLVAYAGLTFAGVRAAAFIAGSGYRKRLMADESAFLEAYSSGSCSLLNTSTKHVYSVEVGERKSPG